jgi:hypothetical protein
MTAYCVVVRIYTLRMKEKLSKVFRLSVVIWTKKPASMYFLRSSGRPKNELRFQVGECRWFSSSYSVSFPASYPDPVVDLLTWKRDKFSSRTGFEGQGTSQHHRQWCVTRREGSYPSYPLQSLLSYRHRVRHQDERRAFQDPSTKAQGRRP